MIHVFQRWKNIRLWTGALLISILFTLGIISCDDDDPGITRVFGTISIENLDVWQTWVDSGEVQLTIFQEFSLDPPAGWGPVPDGFFGPGVPGGTFAIGAPYNAQNPVILEYEPGKTEYDYEIEVDPGTYSAIALGFRHNFINDPNLRSATLGVHWDNPDAVSHGIVIRVDVGGGNFVPVYDFPAPAAFTVDAGEAKEINFTADFDFVNTWYR